MNPHQKILPPEIETYIKELILFMLDKKEWYRLHKLGEIIDELESVERCRKYYLDS